MKEIKRPRIIRAGENVIISHGEYSDYMTTAFGVALKDIDAIALREEWMEMHPDERKRDSFDFRGFTAWLINTKQIIRETPFAEFYLGAYGDTATMDVNER